MHCADHSHLLSAFVILVVTIGAEYCIAEFLMGGIGVSNLFKVDNHSMPSLFLRHNSARGALGWAVCIFMLLLSDVSILTPAAVSVSAPAPGSTIVAKTGTLARATASDSIRLISAQRQQHRVRRMGGGDVV